MYRLVFTSRALEDIKQLAKNVRNSLKDELIQKVQTNPITCSEPLSGPLEAFRSFHYRGYRVVYQVLENLKIVAVVGVGIKGRHRHGEIYKRLEDLARTGELAASVLDTFRAMDSSDEPSEQ